MIEIANLSLLRELNNYQEKLQDAFKFRHSIQKGSLQDIVKGIAYDNSFATLAELELCHRAYMGLMKPMSEANFQGVKNLLSTLNNSARCKKLLFALLLITNLALLIIITKGTALPVLWKVLFNVPCAVSSGVSLWGIFKPTAADKANKLHASLQNKQQMRCS